MLGKVVCFYEYIDEWEKFNKTSLPEKEEFYTNLNMKHITDADYTRAKRVCKDFKIKNFGEHYDFCLKSDALLVAIYFLKNWWKKLLKMSLQSY